MYAIDDVNLWGYSVVYMEIPEVRRETIIPSWDENRRMKMASNRVHEEDDQNRNNIKQDHSYTQNIALIKLILGVET
jgi:hypothetical protein